MACLQAFCAGKLVASGRRGTCLPRAGNGLVVAAPTSSIKLLLPQDDDDTEGRADRLESQQAILNWDHDFIPGCAVAKVVPLQEAFSPVYNAERKAIEDDLLPNAQQTIIGSQTDPLDELQDFEDFFRIVPLPKIAKVYKTDQAFAEQRLSGANPQAIQRLKPNDPRAKVLKDCKFNFNLMEQMKQGRMYLCDYTGTDPDYRGPSMVKGATTPFTKFLPKPLVFYRWSPNQNALRPVAIQIDASADPHTFKPTGARIYTPKEEHPNDWFFAKICAQIADANHHEMCSHLARCHFTMEPIAIAAGRQLEHSHPLSVLLRVHMRFCMANNFLAHGTFFKEKDGNLENLLPGTFPETKALLTEAYDSWGLKSHSFLTEMEKRGVMDTEALPHYPYRDDGLLLWDAIKTFVTSYVGAFYADDDAVASDTELQAFARESADQVNGGKVKQMPECIDTVDELVEILTTIIFTCGPVHSAINFAQMDYIAFAANMPLSAYLNILDLQKQKTPITDKQIVAMLPPFVRAMEQMNVISAIARYHFDTLGFYDKSMLEMYGSSFQQVFAHQPAVLDAMSQFQSDLSAIEDTIKERNESRKVPYEVMLPSLVMNSVSI